MVAPNFNYERSLWQRGFRVIAGVDEVGRGAWAGPLVAAAVVWQRNQNFKFQIKNLVIDDSKKLKPCSREEAAVWIKKNALAWGIGEVGASVINRLGMARATRMAVRRAITEANLKLKTNNSKLIDFLLIDAFYIPFVRGLRRRNQKPIIHGDEKSLSIAAASIIAKVYRDKLMKSLSKQAKFKNYGWERSKGYGTKEHQKAILRYGLTRLHRKAFVATWERKLKANSEKVKTTRKSLKVLRSKL